MVCTTLCLLQWSEQSTPMGVHKVTVVRLIVGDLINVVIFIDYFAHLATIELRFFQRRQ